MKLYKTNNGIIVEKQGRCYRLHETGWDIVLNKEGLYNWLFGETERLQPVDNSEWLLSQSLLAPIGTQEVWAAGVTYLRSKQARMEESEESGGATFYDKVYDAERPELFFKANAAKVAGPAAPVRIRKDSTWNVPEPELTLVVNSASKITGYTIGNDMSSRSIEGENPLYLPQAKMYDGSAAIGPCVWIADKPIPPDTMIAMKIERKGELVFEGHTTIDRMKRKHEELVEFLFREYSHPAGCYLMTGTCVVPDHEFTLQQGDRIIIHIDNIGELVNIVSQ